MNRTRTPALAAALVASLSGCANVFGFDDLHSADDAAIAPSDEATSNGSDAGPAVGVDATTAGDDAFESDVGAGHDGTVSTDATVDADASGDKTVRPDAFGCPPAQLLGLDTTNATRAVSASGIDVYTFTLAQAANVLLRVRTGSAMADITVGTGCDGAGVVLPPSQVAMNGAYSRGHLAPGTYFATIAWDASVAAGSAYSFDLLRYALAGNAACGQPAPLTTAASITGTTFDANDVSAGCRGTIPYGELFYSVTVPPNSAWQITATPSPPVWNTWSLVLQAPSTCASTTMCAVPAALSATPGSPASLTFQNPSMTTPQTFVVGASASPDDAITGGGGFALSATVLASCIGESTPCVGGICCSGHCEPPTTHNGCGRTCAKDCPASGAVCASGACACPDTSPTLCPASGGPTCTNPQTDPRNCAACGGVCTNNDAHALPDVLCKSGACTTTCLPGYTHCNKLCTDFQTDPAHCGKCSGTGSVCPTAEVCQGGHCVCPTTLNPDFCGTACTNLTTDRNNCGACGTKCATAETCQNGNCACPTLARPDFCGGVCTAFTTDRTNCGACGVKCPAAQICQGGTCRCPAPSAPTYCAPSCTNTQNDDTNCGACLTVCTGGQSCNAGHCTCPPNLPTRCAGVCTNTQTDPNHCGACPSRCSGGETCDAGACACPSAANPDFCAGACTNKQLDSANCGACNNACAAPQICQSGACACPTAIPFQCGMTCCPAPADGGAPGCDAGMCF